MSGRGVYLGTKPVDGYEMVATHWAIRVGDDNWWEIDGGSGNEESSLFKNTINMGLVELFPGLPTKKIQKGPVGQVFKGKNARSGAKVDKKVGNTTKTNTEIDTFNKRYIRENPEYSFTANNCQHYCYALVEMLCGDTSLLPMLETRKAAVGVGIGVGTAIGVAAFAGLYSWFSSKDNEDDEKEKEKKKIKGPETKVLNES